MFEFVVGVFFGAVLAVVGFYYVYFHLLTENSKPSSVNDQFPPIQLPPELFRFLNIAANGPKIQPEPSLGLSLILHFLFQEHKDARDLRSWIHKKVQLELNDLTTRSAVGRLIQDVKIRELTLGSQTPIVKGIQVEKCRMSEDGESFEELSFLVDVDYKGGFQISVDALIQFAGSAQLFFKLTHLSGRVRVMLTRQPYAMWAFSFSEMPILDFKIDSHIQGRQLAYLIPLISSTIRRVVMKKHVWPNYKIRSRPFFTNPFLQPSPQMSAYEHIKLTDHGLEVTVLKATRLNTELAKTEQNQVYVTVSLDQRPFIHNAGLGTHSITVLLNVKPFGGSFGVVFSKCNKDLGVRLVKVYSVEPDSPGDKFGFKEGDIMLAVNNHIVRNERQVTRLFGTVSSDIIVLVERNLSYDEQTSQDHQTVLISSGNDSNEEFVCVTEKRADDKPVTLPTTIPRSVSDSPLISEALNPSLSSMSASVPVASFIDSGIESSAYDGPIDSSDHISQSDEFASTPESIESTITASFSKPIQATFPRRDHSVKSLNEAPPRIPKLEVHSPSVEIRRTLSDSHLDSSTDALNMFEGSYRKGYSASTSVIYSNSTYNENFDSVSVSTGAEFDNEFDDGNTTPTRKSKRARFTLKAAGVAMKFGELLRNRNKSSSPSTYTYSDVEFATEANEGMGDCAKLGKNSSPTPSLKNKRRWLYRSRKSPTPSVKSQPLPCSSSPRHKPPPTTYSRTTKHVRLEPNVLWGQSVHFTLDKKEARYLNIAVHARAPPPRDNTSQFSQLEYDIQKPTLLGSVSIYVPQLVADCMLTLSNCHQQVFPLRPPQCDSFNLNAFGDVAKHAGFDPRLCYGDIMLGFRHFPNGLPENAYHNDDDSVDNDDEAEVADEHVSTTYVADLLASHRNDTNIEKHHEFVNASVKFSGVCASCQGKIWTKQGVKCKKCFYVCHTKCIVKVNQTINCVPPTGFDDDGQFEVLDEALLKHREPDTLSNEPPSPSFTDDSVSTTSLFASSSEPVTRQRRFSKFTSTLKNVVTGKRKRDRKDRSPNVSPVGERSVTPPPRMVYIRDVLESSFLSRLQGSSTIRELQFEPGNAYNEVVINKVKNEGMHVFLSASSATERKALIDAQIDTIQDEINKATNIRREIEVKSGDDFESLDTRLQALALLMLHYCSGLQDCDDRATSANATLQAQSILTDIAE